MKNFKKGFIWIVILMVIVVILAVWGVMYYMGQNSSLSSSKLIKDFFPQENKVVNNMEADCLPTTASWIKVVSPNGGEIYQAEQEITVKWKTCNAKVGETISLIITQPNPIAHEVIPVSFFPYQKVNDGVETVTLGGSSTNNIWPFVSGKNFNIDVTLNPLPTNSKETPYVQDSSDAPFTINSQQTNSRKEGEKCGEGIGNCATGLKCFYPCGISGCQNVCAKQGTLPRP